MKLTLYIPITIITTKNPKTDSKILIRANKRFSLLKKYESHKENMIKVTYGSKVLLTSDKKANHSILIYKNIEKSQT